MKHSEDNFTGKNGYKIFYQCWEVESPQAFAVLAHGLAEHSGRYEHVAELLNNKNISVFALDHQGHGKSEGVRSDIDSMDTFIIDLKTFLEIVKEKKIAAGNNSTEKKLFLIGHSMGALIATLFAEKYQKEIDGLVLSGAAVHIVVSPFLKAISGVIAKLFPLAGVQKLDGTAISTDKSVVDKYKEDPLVYTGKVRARMGSSMLKGAEAVFTNISKINIPILIMHGTDDRLADPQGSMNIYQGVSSADKILKLFNGFYHEIFNETENVKVFNLLSEWLYKQLLAC